LSVALKRDCRFHLKIINWWFKDGGRRTSPRKDQGEDGLFRCFSRKWIKERNDGLDISWLKDDDQEDAADLPEPDVLAREAMLELEGAMTDLQDILVQLGFEGEVVG